MIGSLDKKLQKKPGKLFGELLGFCSVLEGLRSQGRPGCSPFCGFLFLWQGARGKDRCTEYGVRCHGVFLVCQGNFLFGRSWSLLLRKRRLRPEGRDPFKAAVIARLLSVAQGIEVAASSIVNLLLASSSLSSCPSPFSLQFSIELAARFWNLQVMAVFILSFLALFSFCAQVLGASLRVQILASNVLPNPNILPASTHATLTSGSGQPIKAVLRKGNYFEFPDISTSGSHLLDIYSRDYVFAAYRVDVAPSSDSSAALIIGAWETYRGTRWEDRGVALVASPTEQLDMSARILSKKNFYEQRQGFNPLSLLKNPMILMGIVALAFTFGMPKLMENMDPEMRAEYEEMQKKSPVGGITRAMQGGGSGGGQESFDLAGFLAGSSKTSGSDRGSNGVRERKR